MAEVAILGCVDERMAEIQPWLLKYLGVGKFYHHNSPVGGSLGFEEYHMRWLDFVVEKKGCRRLHFVDHLGCTAYAEIFGIGREQYLPIDVETSRHFEQFGAVDLQLGEHFGERLEVHYHLLTNVTQHRIHEECVRIPREQLLVAASR